MANEDIYIRLDAVEARLNKLEGGVTLSYPAQVKAEYDTASKKAKVSWSAVPGASAYEVWGGAPGSLARVQTLASLERWSGVMNPGQKLEYAVLSVSQDGTKKSALSPVVQVTASGAVTPPPVTPPPVTPPANGSIPWTQVFPDGRAYSAPNPTKQVSYSGQALTNLTDTRVTGIKLNKGQTLEIKGSTNCIFEIEAKYQQAGDMVKFRGKNRRVGVYNSTFGPDTESAPGFAETCQYLYFGDDVEDIYVYNTTFQNKTSSGNALRVYGTFDVAGAKGGGRYGVYSNLLFRNIRPFDENDHESARVGVSTMQATDGEHVFEFCRFENCASEPEVVSMKMNREVVRGCTFVNCVGGPVMRHGNNSAVHDCHMVGDATAQAAGSTTVRTSSGVRGYGRGHEVHHNSIRVNGTSKYERPILLDYGDASPDGTGNGHANVENWKVYNNLLVKCGAPIVVGKNYGTAPKGCEIKDNVLVECQGADAQGLMLTGPLGTGCTVSGNKVLAIGALTKTGESYTHADAGSRVPFITADMVGKGAVWNPWSGQTPPPIVITPEPIDPGGSVGTPGGSTPPPVGIVQYPADITGQNWKVTLPTSTGGKVTEIKPPIYSMYADKYFFLNGSRDGVIFRVWHGGDTTQNSKNPRSELRERYDDDPEGYWDASKGTHEMEVVLQVNRLTKVKPHTVIAQIHDAADDTVVWRVEDNQLWLTNGNETHGYLVDGNFQLGSRHTLKYRVSNGGKYEFWYDGAKVNYTKTFPAMSYFKTGAYLQSNPEKVPSESTTEYTEVVIYGVKVTHA